MLRQKVLESWNKYKQKLEKEQKFLKFLATESFEETPLPMFPLGIDRCRQNLDSWTSSDYRIKLSQHKSTFIEQQNQLESSGAISEPLGLLAMSYLNTISMFKDLTEGWKKEKDSYARYRRNNSISGPTIQEVDDW